MRSLGIFTPFPYRDNSCRIMGRYRRALRKEVQHVFDELWTHVSKHMMACTLANRLLS